MSKELAKTYDPKGIEDRLYRKWEENGYFHAEVDRSKKTFHDCDASAQYYRAAAYGTCAG